MDIFIIDLRLKAVRDRFSLMDHFEIETELYNSVKEGKFILLKFEGDDITKIPYSYKFAQMSSVVIGYNSIGNFKVLKNRFDFINPAWI